MPKEKQPFNIEQFNNNIPNLINQYTVEQEKPEDDPLMLPTINKIIYKLASLHSTTEDHATIGFCSLLQSGAYLKSVSNRRIRIAGIDFTKSDLLFILQSMECRYTLRNIARYLKNTIALVSYQYQIPGHLFARFKIENPNLIAENDTETIRKFATYCTDFQIENPNTPKEIREYLANREINRRKPRS